MGDSGIKRPRLDNKEFVEVWMRVAKSGGHQQDVADALGCSLAGALGKFKNLLKDGVELPELPRPPRKKSKVDVDGLNELIRSMT